MAHATSTTNRPATHDGHRNAGAPLTTGRLRRLHGAHGRRRLGITLVEAMIATAVLAVSVIAIGASLSATAKQSVVVEEDSTALVLARQLVEEIAAKPYLDPTSGTVTQNATAIAQGAAAAVAAVGGTTPARATFDDVGDYHGYSDTVDGSNPAVSLQGKTVAVANGRHYTRAVTVKFRATPAGTDTTTGDFALVTVTVTGPDGRSVSVSRMVTNTTFLPGSTL